MRFARRVRSFRCKFSGVWVPWCAVKFPMEALFSSGRVVAAIELRNQKDAELLDVLLHEARSAFFRKGMRRIVVLIDDRYATPDYRRLFPSHWAHAKYAGNAKNLAEMVREFWENRPSAETNAPKT